MPLKQRNQTNFTATDSANGLALLGNTPVEAKPFLHSLVLVARGIGLFVKSDYKKFSFISLISLVPSLYKMAMFSNV